MIEMFGLVFFGLVVYMFLVVIPTVVEQICDESFRNAYFFHLSSRHINSYGK